MGDNSALNSDGPGLALVEDMAGGEGAVGAVFQRLVQIALTEEEDACCQNAMLTPKPFP